MVGDELHTVCELSTCKNKCGLNHIQADTGCACDDVCRYFGDCCVDYDHWCLDQDTPGPSSSKTQFEQPLSTVPAGGPSVKPLVEAKFHIDTSEVRQNSLRAVNPTQCTNIVVSKYKDILSLRLVVKCPAVPGEPDSEYVNLAAKCEHTGEDEDTQYLVYTTPVMDSKAAFRNKFCGLCFQQHFNYSDPLQIFPPKIQCMKKTDLDSVMSHLKQGKERSFLEEARAKCILYYEEPSDAYLWKGNARYVCSDNHLISTCNSSTTSLNNEACHAYRAPVKLKNNMRSSYGLNNTGYIGFRSSFCASCWGNVSDGHLACFSWDNLRPDSSTDTGGRVVVNLPSFSLLLDFSGGDQSEVRVKLGDDLVCPSNTLRDINNDKCVVSVCPKGRVQLDDACVRLDDEVQQPLGDDQVVSIIVQFDVHATTESQYAKFLYEVKHNIEKIFFDTMFDRNQYMLTVKISECHHQNMSLSVVWENIQARNKTKGLSVCLLGIFNMKQSDHFTFQQRFLANWKLVANKIHIGFLTSFQGSKNIPTRQISVTLTNYNILRNNFQCPGGNNLKVDQNFQLVTDANDTFGILLNETDQFLADTSRLPMAFTLVKDIGVSKSWLPMTQVISSQDRYLKTLMKTHICEPNILSCPKSIVSAQNVSIDLSNDTLIFLLNGDNVVLLRHNYVMLNNTLVYCTDSITRINDTMKGTSQPLVELVEGWMTLVGIILSLVGLVLTLCTYSIFPSLRNTPGKSIMNLSVALFLAQLLFQINYLLIRFPKGCTAIAAFQHYFWLSAFSWMTVLAADICGTFVRMKVTQKQNSAMFRWYLACGWGVPLTFVAVCVGVDLGTSLDFDYGDDTKCWIAGHSLSAVYAFAVPVGMVVLINLGLFITTVVSLRKTMKIAQKATKTNDNMKHFKIYVRLSSVMGFTWVFGFLANWKPLWFMAFPFIIFNTLQGVFICASFVINKRVLMMYKKKWCASEVESSKTDNTCNTSMSMSHVRDNTKSSN